MATGSQRLVRYEVGGINRINKTYSRGNRVGIKLRQRGKTAKEIIMATIIKKNGKNITLLNPSEKGRKYADELRNGVRQRNDGLLKTDPVLGRPVRLTKEQRSYRAGYLDAQKDSAKAYNARKEKK